MDFFGKFLNLLRDKTVVDTAQQTTKVIEGAKPIASTIVETISSSDLTVIAGTAGALFIAYLLLPPIWSGITFNFCGYKELPSELRGLVRNVKKVEAELAGLKISYMKKINKGSNIVIMDSYSDSAKIVARTLTSLGFKNTGVVSPLRVIPAAARGFGTTFQSSTKLLPGAD
ncbi:Calcium sensing receptor [Arachis hypogaea]|nr:Calcium sensing receptor [Arachis hypogaea]